MRGSAGLVLAKVAFGECHPKPGTAAYHTHGSLSEQSRFWSRGIFRQEAGLCLRVRAPSWHRGLCVRKDGLGGGSHTLQRLHLSHSSAGPSESWWVSLAGCGVFRCIPEKSAPPGVYMPGRKGSKVQGSWTKREKSFRLPLLSSRTVVHRALWFL